MKFMKIGLLVLFLIITAQAGKVTWSDNGVIDIAGTIGEGCVQSEFKTLEEDQNITKSSCL